MRVDPRGAPLVLRVPLTDDQRRQVLEQTGYDVSALPYASGATAVLCTFRGIILRVPRGVFVPTAATEHLLYAAIEAASAFPRPTIVDVGTGCGVVALAAAAALPRASVFATDVSDVALGAARSNRARLRLHNVRFCRGSLLSPLPRRLFHRVAVVVANVPYVPPQLADVAEYAYPEGTAIGPGEDGLGLVRELADSARQFLMPGGLLVLQLAAFQWAGFGSALTTLGYKAPELEQASIDAPVTGRIVWPG